MSKSYKMVLLLAMLNLDQFLGSVTIDELMNAIERILKRSAVLTRAILALMLPIEKLSAASRNESDRSLSRWKRNE